MGALFLSRSIIEGLPRSTVFFPYRRANLRHSIRLQLQSGVRVGVRVCDVTHCTTLAREQASLPGASGGMSAYCGAYPQANRMLQQKTCLPNSRYCIS